MNPTRLNTRYTQTGKICVFASYAIIMEYFSNGNKKIPELFNIYISANKLPHNTSMDTETKENLISAHYHFHCQKNKLRGFCYIATEHKNNKYKTDEYCKVIDVQTSENIPLITEIKSKLKNDLLNGGLAMVLMMNNDGSFHSIVIGYVDTLGYFYRNPHEQKICYDDFLQENDIYEFILFDPN